MTKLSIPYLKKGRFIKREPDSAEFERLKGIVATVRDHLSNLSQINDHVGLFFESKFTIKEKAAKDILNNEISQKVLQAFLEELDGPGSIDEGAFKGIIKKIEKEAGAKGKLLYQPIRIAITGQLHGPELKLIIPILGRESCIKRVKQVLKKG